MKKVSLSWAVKDEESFDRLFLKEGKGILKRIPMSLDMEL